MYYKLDLTGTKEEYKISNRIFCLSKENQRVYLEEGVFADTIKIFLMGNVNTPLVAGVDWVFEDSDLDLNVKSQALLEDETFNRDLVKSIKITKIFASHVKISVSYQKIYPESSLLPFGDDEDRTIVFTPKMLESILLDLSNLKRMYGSLNSKHAINENIPSLLEEDPLKNKPENYIEKEEFRLSVPEERAIISPAYGAFYDGSETIYSDVLKRNLVKDTEYKTLILDVERTKKSPIRERVCRAIIVLIPLTDTVEVSYHAFGGDITLDDGKNLQREITDLTNHINDAGFLTPDSLGGCDPFSRLVDKVNYLGEEMRVLAKAGRPSYGDVTDGRILKKKIHAPDSDLNWWTIAELYQVDGSTEIFTADVFKCRLRTNYSNFMFDLTVSVNLNNPDEPLKVVCNGCNFPKGYVPFSDYSQIDFIMRPQLRIIWNENIRKDSGLLLQFGLPLKNISEETLVVEDLSGRESCFLLEANSELGFAPQNDAIELPSVDQVWSLSNGDSREVRTLIPQDDGYLVWAGAMQLNNVDGWGAKELSHLLHDDFDLLNIKGAKLELKERDGNKFAKSVEFVRDNTFLTGQINFVYNQKPAHIILNIYRDSDSHLKMSLNYEIQAGSSVVPLDLHHIILYA